MVFAVEVVWNASGERALGVEELRVFGSLNLARTERHVLRISVEDMLKTRILLKSNVVFPQSL